MTGTRVVSILLGVAIIFTVLRIPETKQGFEFNSLVTYETYDNFQIAHIEDTGFINYNNSTSVIKPLRQWLQDISDLHPDPENFLTLSYYFENGVIQGDWGVFDGFRLFLNLFMAPLQMIWNLAKVLFGLISFLFVR